MPTTPPRSARPAALLCAESLRDLWAERGDLIQALQDLGFKVVCVGRDDATAAALRLLDCETETIAWGASGEGSFADLRAAWRLFRLMKTRGVVTAFGFGSRPNLLIGLAARLAGVGYVATVPRLDPAVLGTDSLSRMLRRLKSLTYGAAYATVFHNRADLAICRELGLASDLPSRVLPGAGVPLDRFPFHPLKRPVTTFVMASRLAREKGVLEYLEAAERLKRERPGLRFLLAGSPDPSGDGLSVRDVTSFGTAVEYLGEVADIRPVLLKAECLVLPSLREGMPRSVMEAAALGRMAIVSDVKGCRDAIEAGKTGFLCEPRSAASLADAMRRATQLTPSEVAAMSREARALAERRFDERLSTHAYIEFALGIAGARRPSTPAGSGDRSGRPLRQDAK